MDRASISAAFECSLSPALEPADDLLEYLICAGLFGNSKARTTTWGDYGTAIARQAERIVPRKDAAPILGYFLGGRTRGAVTAVTALFLDFDEIGGSGGGPGVVDSLRGALDALGMAYSLSESCSSAPGAERWHLVLPLASRVPFPHEGKEHSARWALWSAEYVVVADAVCALAGVPRREWDPMCKNANRIRYVGSRLSESAATRQVYHRSGRRLRWGDLVAALRAVGARDPEPAEAQAAAQEQAAWSAPQEGAWPGPRTFTRADYEESHERCLLYLSSPRCPVSVDGSGGDTVAYQTAVKVLRGFPLCGPARLQAIPDEGAPVDPADAMQEAYELLRRIWNPRCLARDGETPFPWDQERLAYKVEQAAIADRLPGPDYWIFDEPGPRAKWAKRRPGLRLGVGQPRGRGVGGGADAADVDGEAEVGEPETGDADSESLESDWAVQAEPAEPDDARAQFLAEGAEVAGPGAFTGISDDGLPPDPGAVERIALPDAPPVEIEITHRYDEMASQALAALRRHPMVYVWDKKLCVRARSHDPSLPPTLYVAKRGNLMEFLSNEKYAKWYTRGDEEVDRVPERPDSGALKCLHDRQYWEGLRMVRAVVSTPVLTRDPKTDELRLLQRPGHDAASGILYDPPPGPWLDPISDRPSKDDCRAALGALLDVVRDFPFDDRRKSFSAWLSAVLTRFCRYAFSGNIPLFAVSATMASSGKGKLRDAAAIITDGVQSSVTGYEAGNEGEVERKIGMEILNGERHVCIDNIPEGVKLASPTLEAMLTSPNFSTRKIGTSEKIRSSLTETIPWATGNNMELGGDLWRRTIVMHIADRSGCPDDRQTTHPELEEWCRHERRRLVHAALTLVAGYVAAGQPRAKLPPMASFEGWGLVRQIVVWCGLPDPFESRGEVTDDDDVAVRPALFSALRTAMGDGQWTAGAVGQELETEAGRKRHPKLVAILKEARVKGSPDALGAYLHAKHQNKSVKMPNGEVWTLIHKRSANGRFWRIAVEDAESARKSDKSSKKQTKKHDT